MESVDLLPVNGGCSWIPATGDDDCLSGAADTKAGEVKLPAIVSAINVSRTLLSRQAPVSAEVEDERARYDVESVADLMASGDRSER